MIRVHRAFVVVAVLSLLQFPRPARAFPSPTSAGGFPYYPGRAGQAFAVAGDGSIVSELAINFNISLDFCNRYTGLRSDVVGVGPIGDPLFNQGVRPGRFATTGNVYGDTLFVPLNYLRTNGGIHSQLRVFNRAGVTLPGWNANSPLPIYDSQILRSFACPRSEWVAWMSGEAMSLKLQSREG